MFRMRTHKQIEKKKRGDDNIVLHKPYARIHAHTLHVVEEMKNKKNDPRHSNAFNVLYDKS